MNTRLYVGNLSFDTTEDTLTQTFEKDSRKVSNVAVVTDRDTGRPRGFAFVEMASEADAQAAVEQLDGTELDGRTLRVDRARERQESRDHRPDSGGGGRGRSQGGW